MEPASATQHPTYLARTNKTSVFFYIHTINRNHQQRQRGFPRWAVLDPIRLAWVRRPYLPHKVSVGTSPMWKLQQWMSIIVLVFLASIFLQYSYNIQYVYFCIRITFSNQWRKSVFPSSSKMDYGTHLSFCAYRTEINQIGGLNRLRSASTPESEISL
jgi:hypothetical protein